MMRHSFIIDRILPELEHYFSESDGDIVDCGFSDNSDSDPDYIQGDLYLG